MKSSNKNIKVTVIVIVVLCLSCIAAILRGRAPRPLPAPAQEGYTPSSVYCAVTNYDNMDSGDDPNAGSFVEMYNVTRSFLEKVPVCAIWDKHWSKLKYHFLDVTVKSPATNKYVTFRVIAMDMCSDKDQNSSCTKNMAEVGRREKKNVQFLVDIDVRTKARVLPGVGDIQIIGTVRDAGPCNMNALNALMKAHQVKWHGRSGVPGR